MNEQTIPFYLLVLDLSTDALRKPSQSLQDGVRHLSHVACAHAPLSIYHSR